uniref:Uncharacterized protein n=1 Tax=Candidatus Kentrum sp. FM TaxID=2126340 RepID=A0A450S1G8_9GAMM|nr:MAG: hypothetical protein BECKFM1743C_GA0114222_100208 [Candidatus Kentron sp. FM]VFJ45507.1 MAG: hypothetical protein BECKFM1743A_GA0114220_100258 [Candidatus Kentron sp. FM]VFK06714.1 MAG: hypothetical protein BECKFM1743B_GA0114221_100238 [Candidatus Kentron sp. FM]
MDYLYHEVTLLSSISNQKHPISGRKYNGEERYYSMANRKYFMSDWKYYEAERHWPMVGTIWGVSALIRGQLSIKDSATAIIMR